MRLRIGIPEDHVQPDVIDAALEAVTRLDDRLIRSGQSPTSHQALARGAVWRPENMGDEHFDHGATLAQRGWGDCDDWAPLHAATLRATGEDPGAIARVIPSGPSTYHALVQRSDGRIEDPSVWAGMKPLRAGPGTTVVGGLETIDILACDPHDGRVYQGALAPAVGPLSLHCGLAQSVRGCHVVGLGDLYEARVDVPIAGSPLVHVRSYRRARPRGLRRRVHGAVPYCLSCSSLGLSPGEALHRAVVGALYASDATGMATPLDRYKLMASQWAMRGMSPGAVQENLIRTLQQELPALAASTGTHPDDHANAMLAELAAQGHIDGRRRIGGLFSGIAAIASGVVHAVSNVVAKVGPWVGTILHGIQSIVSVIPGLGTVVSDVLATAESAYDELAAIAGGNPLEGALKAAYNYATATVPGAAAIRFVTDPVVNTLLSIATKKEPIESALMNGILSDVPASPAIGPLSPRSVVASLGHLIVSHLGVKQSPPGAKAIRPAPMTPAQGGIAPGQPIVVHPSPAVHAQVLAKSAAVGAQTPHKLVKMTTRPAVTAAKAAAPAGAPPPVAAPAPAPAPVMPSATAAAALPVKPLGVAHAAAPAFPGTPPHPTAQQAPALAPAKPGAAPGSQLWRCAPLPGGEWACSWQ